MDDSNSSLGWTGFKFGEDPLKIWRSMEEVASFRKSAKVLLASTFRPVNSVGLAFWGSFVIPFLRKDCNSASVGRD